jgi:hypothetical protein
MDEYDISPVQGAVSVILIQKFFDDSNFEPTDSEYIDVQKLTGQINVSEMDAEGKRGLIRGLPEDSNETKRLAGITADIINNIRDSSSDNVKERILRIINET